MNIYQHIPYILESNPHPFYSFRGLKGQMRIRIECGLDSRSRAGVCPNDRAGVRAVRTIQGGKNEVRIRFENIRYLKSPLDRDKRSDTCLSHFIPRGKGPQSILEVQWPPKLL
jgi:hypothetical protein